MKDQKARLQDIQAEYDADYKRLGNECRRGLSGWTRHLGIMGHGQGGRLLEIGAGTGFLVAGAALRGWRTIAVEISEAAARLIRSNAPDTGVVIGDATRLPFRRNAFDWTVAVGTIECTLNPDKALAEACSTVRSGGRLLVQIMNQGGSPHASRGTGPSPINFRPTGDWVRRLVEHDFEVEAVLPDPFFHRQFFEPVRHVSEAVTTHDFGPPPGELTRMMIVARKPESARSPSV